MDVMIGYKFLRRKSRVNPTNSPALMFNWTKALILFTQPHNTYIREEPHLAANKTNVETIFAFSSVM